MISDFRVMSKSAIMLLEYLTIISQERIASSVDAPFLSDLNINQRADFVLLNTEDLCLNDES